MCGTYEGHKNYETWAVSLWLNNEERLYRMVHSWRAANAEELAKRIQEYVEEGAEFITSRASLYSDIITATLNSVDWIDVAEDFRPDEGWPDEQEEEAEDEDGEEDDELDPLYDCVYIDILNVATRPDGTFERRAVILMRRDLDYWPAPSDPNDYDAEARRYA